MPPQGAALPISVETLFQVLVVQDALDPYPTKPSDPLLGRPTFKWTIKPPGATTRQPLTGANGASVPIDPSTYTPGDQLELRVEIEDRTHTPITCADNMPTCSVNGTSCIQRLTWLVEAR